MNDTVREDVRRRAGDRCEYCHPPQAGHGERFSVDHVIPRKHHGDDSVENLALCCLRCNLFKGPNLSGVDSASGDVITLFNPRRGRWADHFRWEGARITGRTVAGRVAVDVLQMNAPERVRLREALIAAGEVHPEWTSKSD